MKPVTVVAAFSFFLIRFPRTWRYAGFERIETFGTRLAQRRSLSVFLVGASLFVIRGVGALVTGVPLPRYHDEFSYLLAADTFARGRLANPPHPMWVHFETYHVIWHPTYASMYPPGEGLILAMGQVLGNPWIGQLLASALMCAGICWMLQGWIPPRWALLGGVLVVARLGLLSYFTNGYWSACLPAFGGALVLGALPRIWNGLNWLHASVLGAGFFILANTRPYEGLLVSATTVVALLAWMIGKKKPALLISLRKVILPLACTLAPLAVWTGYYYYRVTGSPFHMAYSINRDMYAMGRYFIWQKPSPQKQYEHAILKAYYERELDEANQNRTLRGFFFRAKDKLYYFSKTYLVAPLPFFLIALPCALRDRRLRFGLLALGVLLVGLAVEIWSLPHYFAPGAALLYLILLQSARHMRWFRWHDNAVGLAMVRAISVVYIATAVLRIALAMIGAHPEKEWQHGDLERAAIVQKLEALPEEHVVLVNYGPSFDLDREWVYNGADIDSQKIVWARDMGPEKNQELLDYYRGRRFWQLSVDGGAQLAPYSATIVK